MTKKFIVVSQARTGSTALVTSLMQHKEVATHGEVFGGKNNPNLNIFGIQNKLNPPVVDYLRSVRDKEPITFLEGVLFREGSYKATGFKFKYEELSLPEWSQLVKHIAGNKDIHIIFLTRENLLDRELSEYVALNITKIFNTRDKNYSQKPVSVEFDPKDLERRFKKSQKWQHYYAALFSKNPSISLTYDELNTDCGNTLARVQNYLGLEQQDIAPLTRKLHKNKASESIVNYEALVKYFSDTEYSHFFNDN